MIPGCEYRFTLRRGHRGHDVWAIQLNLNAWRLGQDLEPLAEDGVFGPQTFESVRTFQRRKGLVKDGICGILTKRALMLEHLDPKEIAFAILPRLLRGGCALESGFDPGAVNCGVPGGIDCGPMQHRIPDGAEESRYRAAFSGPEAFASSAKALRDRKDLYHGQPGAESHIRAWEIACLAHNWPAAAERFAAGEIDEWVYRETVDGKKVERRMDEPAVWIKRLQVPGVETGFQWSAYYTDLWFTFV